jgi:hypothetical protein
MQFVDKIASFQKKYNDVEIMIPEKGSTIAL